MPRFITLTLMDANDPAVLGSPVYVAIDRIVSFSPRTDARKLTLLITDAHVQFVVLEKPADIVQRIVMAAADIKLGAGKECHVRSDGPPA